MNIKFKKLNRDAVTPSYAKEGDAGLDLTAISSTLNTTERYFEYSTGLAVEIPNGYVGLIFPRSSISNKDLYLTNAVGVIDSGYRGEIKFRFKSSHIHAANIYKPGDRIGQLLIIPYPHINIEIVDDLSFSDRGSKGFGSSNEK